MKNTAAVTPGLHVDIVLSIDIQKEATDVRGALVYDVNGADVILSQTNPPFTEGRHTGKNVSVTYLIREKNSMARYGFDGKVVDVIKAYCLSSILEYGQNLQSVVECKDTCDSKRDALQRVMPPPFTNHSRFTGRMTIG